MFKCLVQVMKGLGDLELVKRLPRIQLLCVFSSLQELGLNYLYQGANIGCSFGVYIGVLESNRNIFQCLPVLD